MIEKSQFTKTVLMWALAEVALGGILPLVLRIVVAAAAGDSDRLLEFCQPEQVATDVTLVCTALTAARLPELLEAAREESSLKFQRAALGWAVAVFVIALAGTTLMSMGFVQLGLHLWLRVLTVLGLTFIVCMISHALSARKTSADGGAAVGECQMQHEGASM